MSGTLAGLSSPSTVSFDSSVSRTTLTIPSQSHLNIDINTLNDASSEVRHLIDQELLRLEDSIRALRSRRNALAPISRLPPEILSKVFADCVAECTESANPLEWIRVTHVSRYWRAVAFDCPSLWVNLVFTRPQWLKEMLKRSRMAGLVVKADLSCFTPRIFEAVRLALLHAPRIVNLQLRASSANIRRLLTTEPSLQIPIICSLSLSVPSAIRFDEDFTLPDTVLTGETSHLRRLELNRVNINWNSRFLRDLTHLTIHDVATSARPTMDQLMNALERMPALEVFDIQDALPLTSHGLSTDRFVGLPHLTSLSVASTVPECVNLVSFLIIPVNASVHLSCSGTETTRADFSGVMRIISDPTGATRYQENDSLPERKSIRELHIRHEAPVTLVIHGWTNALAPHEADPGINIPDIDLHFSWHPSPHIAVDSVAASVCKAIQLTPLSSLRIAYVDDIPPKIWIDIFGLLLKLHSVHIVGPSARALVSALRQEAPIEDFSSRLVTPERSLEVEQFVPSVYFPQLKSLTFEDASFDESDTSQTTLTFCDLQSCLIERLERKAGIQKLCFRECSHLCVDDIQALTDFVTVDWDEVDQGISEELENGYDELGGYIFGSYDVYGEDDLDIDSSIL